MSKRVLIVLAPLGSGHRSIAQAVTEALTEFDRSVIVEQLDIFSREGCRFPLTLAPRLYALFTSRYPFLWRAMYYGTNSRSRYAIAERISQPFVYRRLKDTLARCAPDTIVSVFPALGFTLDRAIRDLHRQIPLGIVVVDMFSIHQAWLFNRASWYAVPTDEAATLFRNIGISPELVHPSGLPLRQAFTNLPDDRVFLRSRLGLPETGQIVLISSTGVGAGRLNDIVRGFVAGEQGVYSVVITGQDQGLCHRLEDAVGGSLGRILGRVDNMAEWMASADVLVTKAGPTTIAEAIQCRLPMVVTGAIPGQEEGNLTFIKESGIGLVASRSQDIISSVMRLLFDKALTLHMKDVMTTLQRPRAAREVAELILGGL